MFEHPPHPLRRWLRHTASVPKGFLRYHVLRLLKEKPMSGSEIMEARANLINLPMMFASNAFYPVKLMPDWLQPVVNINLLSYTNDAIRQLLIVNTIDYTQLTLDCTYIGIFAVVVATIGIILSWRFLSK